MQRRTCAMNGNVLCVATLWAALTACTQPRPVEVPAPEVLCPEYAIDMVSPVCADAAWQLPACGTTTTLDGADFGGQHVELAKAITYAESPPLSGQHRDVWPRWGEYRYLPPQRYLHNLEHGSVAILYNPCAPQSLIDQLRAFARARPADGGGQFRWVLTPYPGLDAAFSLVTWRHRLKGNCWNGPAAEQFLAAHYRDAPEDVALDGSYNCEWLGKLCTADHPGAPDAGGCDDVGDSAASGMGGGDAR